MGISRARRARGPGAGDQPRGGDGPFAGRGVAQGVAASAIGGGGGGVLLEVRSREIERERRWRMAEGIGRSRVFTIMKKEVSSMQMAFLVMIFAITSLIFSPSLFAGPPLDERRKQLHFQLSNGGKEIAQLETEAKEAVDNFIYSLQKKDYDGAFGYWYIPEVNSEDLQEKADFRTRWNFIIELIKDLKVYRHIKTKFVEGQTGFASAYYGGGEPNPEKHLTLIAEKEWFGVNRQRGGDYSLVRFITETDQTHNLEVTFYLWYSKDYEPLIREVHIKGPIEEMEKLLQGKQDNFPQENYSNVYKF